MTFPLINSTYLGAWRADLRDVNEITFKRLGRNLDAYAGNVSERLALDAKQEASLSQALSASRDFIERCHSKSIVETARSLPSHAVATQRLEALIASLDGVQLRTDDFL